MGAAIWLVVRPYALKALAVVAAIVTVLAILARAKNAGRMAERVEIAQQASRIEREMAKAGAKRTTQAEMLKRLDEGTY